MSNTSEKPSSSNEKLDDTRLRDEKEVSESEDSIQFVNSPPPKIDRYEIDAQLGKGGFGHVYKAYDPKLKRFVAIKVPRWDRPLRQEELDRFNQEGEMLARIRHASIVTVHNVGETTQGVPFVVMELVEGRNLSDVIKEGSLTLRQSLSILLKIAEALKVAHQASVVHRDLKPGNVIVDNNLDIRLVDFGLALHDDLSMSEFDTYMAGTPSYMSPEQLRGENHRIDGRTDIWAFGVTMYRMLTKKLPFKGKTNTDLTRAVRYKHAKPLRQWNEHIPKEVERICLKCISKLIIDRYQSMPDLIDDLRDAINEYDSADRYNSVEMSGVTHELKTIEEGTVRKPNGRESSRLTPSNRSASGSSDESKSEPLTISFKGLLPFDSSDKDFFLRLLPGPTHRGGVPESIRFWNTRIEGDDELEPLKVGIIYGPSGCGKSSFVRAGLLPRLSANINPIYLECSASNTERRLARQIGHKIASVDADHSLTDILRQFRRGEHLDSGDKLLIVLDQFEQWLYGNTRFEETELAEALRQCDGKNIIAILLVRDDFWMSTSQLMKSLEIPIREGQNLVALPLFNLRHARKVLIAYGRLFDRLPNQTDENGDSLNRQQKQFIKDAVDSLAQNDKVICVHLSVFAQIAKDRDWTASELRRLGGSQGVGIRFLDDLFGFPNEEIGNEKVEIVKVILRELLPVSRTNIKGAAKSRSDLFDALNGRYSRLAFDQTVDHLENDLSLISPAELTDTPELDESGASSRSVTGDRDSLKLTHDFLVSPIREWLERKQKETWRGRATSRLADLASLYAENQNRRFIPSPIEYVQIALGVNKNNINADSQLLLKAAHKFYLLCAAAAAIFVAIVIGAVWLLNYQANKRNAESVYKEFHKASSTEILTYEDRIWKNRHNIRQLIEKDDLTDASPKTILRRALAGIMAEREAMEDIEVVIDQIETMSENDIVNLQHIFQRSSLCSSFISECTDRFHETESNLERARIAIVLSILGDTACLVEATRTDEDPTDRTLVICNFAELIIDELFPFQLLQNTDKPDLQSAMLSVIWLQDESLYPDELEDVVLDLLENSGDAVVHSCAFALAKQRKWKIEFGPARPDSDWMHIEEIGLTLVKVPSGTLPDRENSSDTEVDLNIESFWICNQEINNPLFLEFVGDDIYPGDRPKLENIVKLRSNNKPVIYISAADAMQFCNWLNWRIKKGDSYERRVRWFNLDEWVELDVPGGFYIPDYLELEWASRGGSHGDLVTGDLTTGRYLNKFEVLRSFDLGKPEFELQPMWSRLPNNYGLFQSNGNASELCFGVSGTTDVFCRGGRSPTTFDKKSYLLNDVRLRRINVGLRVKQRQ